MKQFLEYSNVRGGYQEAVNERTEWEREWRAISNFLLPGRGIYNRYTYTKRKRKLTTPNVINTVAEDALYVLTSGMHGGLTSPSRPWFDLEWSDKRLSEVEFLKAWMEESTLRLHTSLQTSNFYSIINSFYIEYAGFGTGTAYVGHDTGSDEVAFRFELLTAGEYAFTMGADGRPYSFFRTVYMSARQVYERFGDAASSSVKKQIKDNSSGIDTVNITVLEAVYKEAYNVEMPYTRVFYEETGGNTTKNVAPTMIGKKPLEIAGFHEFPYPIGRWGTIGSDIYGVGPGSRALPDIKRLQEMEKAFLMATHKAINPPLNIPARMRGKTSTLPGGKNYYANPQETINEIYQVSFDYQGVGSAVERVEQRIQRNFFNDIFLTAARDPNATPYKATEVNAREQEKMLRLGPVIERLQHEFLQPLIDRCFNIMLRKGLLPEMPPEYQEMAGEYNISLISPLATAQRSVALNGVNAFMGFIGQAAQFDQSILDNLNADEAARDLADITGVRLGILRTEEEVAKIRADRQKAMQAQQQKEEAAQQGMMGSQINAEQAGAAKTQAEAGNINADTQQILSETGMI